MTDPFDTADYYECSENIESLSHDSPEEALETYLDGYMEPDCDAEAVIRKNCPVTCTAFTRTSVPPGQARKWAEAFADLLNEWWPEEEYGDPDADADGPGDKRFIEDVTPVIQAAIDRTHVWQCQKVGTRTYSADEVLTMMRAEVPDWFEKEDPTHPIHNVARWLSEWAWSDSRVWIDRRELRKLVTEDEATAGYLPTEDQCREFIVGEGDTGTPPPKLVTDFPKTNAFLETHWDTE